jgi:hypothetical protein
MGKQSSFNLTELPQCHDPIKHIFDAERQCAIIFAKSPDQRQEYYATNMPTMETLNPNLTNRELRHHFSQRISTGHVRLQN